MRLKLGRPDLADYAGYFDAPQAAPDASLTVTWAGVTTLLIDDGASAVMSDGFFSRPSLAEVGLRPLSPSAPRIDGCLPAHGRRSAGCRHAGTHPLRPRDGLGRRSPSAPARGWSAEPRRCRSAGATGCPTTASSRSRRDSPSPSVHSTSRLIEASHCPPDRFPGVIDEPVVPPVKVSAFKCGEAWSTLVRHRASDRRLLIVGSAGYVRGALAGQRADVVYLGVGQLGLQPEPYLVEYWAETVRTVGARRVVLIHWDDFFRPLHKPLRALPYAADDLDVSMRVLSAAGRRGRCPAASAHALAAR